MTFVAIFLVNATLSFALSLLVAALLGPDGFGRYAVALSVTLVINTALFEWMRLSTTRFYSERVRTAEPSIRATLNRAYLATSLALSGVTAVALLLPFDLGLSPTLLAAAAACGLAYGLCEYPMALARARFLQGPYAAIVLARGIGGFVFAAGAAWLSSDPAWVLAGAALAALVPVVALRRRLADPASAAPPVRRDMLGAFARYALPLVAASALYQLMPLANRTILAGREGFAEAGYFALASEICQRLFQNLGAALDLVLFQVAVRAEELHGRAAAERQVTRNLGAVAAIVIPAAAGFWVVWPAFEAVFVPAAFQGRVAGTMAAMIPALAAFALVQYALNPIFQLRRRTAPVVAAAAAAIAVDLAAVLFWPGLAGPDGFAAAQLAGFGAGFGVLCGTAVASGARMPWRDLGAALAATAVMVAALWPTRGLAPPVVLLAGQVALGGGVYGGLALAFDLAGARRLLVARRWRPAPNAG